MLVRSSEMEKRKGFSGNCFQPSAGGGDDDVRRCTEILRTAELELHSKSSYVTADYVTNST